MEEVKPLGVRFTKRGNADYNSALDWLASRDDGSAERFNTVFGQTVTDLCQSIAAEIAQGGRPFTQPDREASLVFSRPVYRHRFETVKKRQRRSSSGVWFLYVALTDTDGDETLDTLNIVAVRYGAAAPLWNIGGTDQEGTESDR